jgi:hypothetical protein
MDFGTQDVWRWNVDPVWHHFSWMLQEAALATTVKGTFARYHHVSACLYFGIGAIEAFLNKKMRQRFTGIKTEDEIHEMLRSPQATLMKKVKEWPSILCGVEIEIPAGIVSALDDFRKLRGEITHQKRHDHSLFADLDATQPENLVEAVNSFQVTILEHLKEVFPYWLLGWNYIGINNDPEAPCLINNQQLRYSLRALGEDVPAADYEAALTWEAENMSTLAGFRRLKNILDAKTIDIEPFSATYPNRPRLTRNWWDQSLRRG